jgi:hypothetical protein
MISSLTNRPELGSPAKCDSYVRYQQSLLANDNKHQAEVISRCFFVSCDAGIPGFLREMSRCSLLISCKNSKNSEVSFMKGCSGVHAPAGVQRRCGRSDCRCTTGKPLPEPSGAALTESWGVTKVRRAPAIIPPAPVSMVALTE